MFEGSAATFLTSAEEITVTDSFAKKTKLLDAFVKYSSCFDCYTLHLLLGHTERKWNWEVSWQKAFAAPPQIAFATVGQNAVPVTCVRVSCFLTELNANYYTCTNHKICAPNSGPQPWCYFRFSCVTGCDWVATRTRRNRGSPVLQSGVWGSFKSPRHIVQQEQGLPFDLGKWRELTPHISQTIIARFGQSILDLPSQAQRSRIPTQELTWNKFFFLSLPLFLSVTHHTHRGT